MLEEEAGGEEMIGKVFVKKYKKAWSKYVKAP